RDKRLVDTPYSPCYVCPEQRLGRSQRHERPFLCPPDTDQRLRHGAPIAGRSRREGRLEAPAERLLQDLLAQEKKPVSKAEEAHAKAKAVIDKANAEAAATLEAARAKAEALAQSEAEAGRKEEEAVRQSVLSAAKETAEALSAKVAANRAAAAAMVLEKILP